MPEALPGQPEIGKEPEAMNARAAIVALLSDGRLHTAEEMHAAGGRRYGARVWEIRRAWEKAGEPRTITTVRMGAFRSEYAITRIGPPEPVRQASLFEELPCQRAK